MEGLEGLVCGRVSVCGRVRRVGRVSVCGRVRRVSVWKR